MMLHFEKCKLEMQVIPYAEGFKETQHDYHQTGREVHFACITKKAVTSSPPHWLESDLTIF